MQIFLSDVTFSHVDDEQAIEMSKLLNDMLAVLAQFF